MSESVQNPDAGEVEQAQDAEPKTFTEDYVKELRKEAARHRTEARAAVTELEQLRQASLSDTEKAIAEAEQRGRLAAQTELGQELVRSAFVAAAARRNADYDATAVLDDLNLPRYLGEDGRPDSDAISAAVERLVPGAESSVPPVPSFDGGVRANPTDNSTASLFAKAMNGVL